MVTEKEKLNRALNYYLRSLQSLKHTYHLWIRVGGGVSRSRKLRKNRRNASVFASEFFRKRNQANGEFFSNERFLVLDYTLSELLAVVAAA